MVNGTHTSRDPGRVYVTCSQERWEHPSLWISYLGVCSFTSRTGSPFGYSSNRRRWRVVPRQSSDQSPLGPILYFRGTSSSHTRRWVESESEVFYERSTLHTPGHFSYPRPLSTRRTFPGVHSPVSYRSLDVLTNQPRLSRFPIPPFPRVSSNKSVVGFRCSSVTSPESVSALS